LRSSLAAADFDGVFIAPGQAEADRNDVPGIPSTNPVFGAAATLKAIP
jgi:hypothetical protein